MSEGITIKGLDRLLKKVKKLSEVVKTDVDTECELAAHEMNAEASQNINQRGVVDSGELLSKQQVIDDKPNRKYTVQNTAFYAPYQEFGTGFKFESLPDWVPIAAQFKGASQDHPGIMARPFMQPAFEKVKPLLIQRIKNIIKDALSS